MLLLIKILNYRLTVILIQIIICNPTNKNSEMLGEFPNVPELQTLIESPQKIERSKVHLSYFRRLAGIKEDNFVIPKGSKCPSFN